MATEYFPKTTHYPKQQQEPPPQQQQQPQPFLPACLPACL
jgi:hypothetical protein